MKHFLVPAAVMLLLGVTVISGQTRFTERGSPAITDAYQTGLKTYYKTWGDLNHAQRQVVPNPGDWYRYDVARGQMDLLTRTWQDGSFDRSQLNQAISDLEFVLTFNNLSKRDRDALSDDLEHLRDIRVRSAG